MAAVAKLCRAQGKGLVLVNHPWIVQPGLSASAQVRRVPFAMDAPLANAYLFGRTYTARTQCPSLQSVGVETIDPQQAFDTALALPDKVAVYFSDTIHYTAQGNYLLAKEVYAGLMRLQAVQAATGRQEPVAAQVLDGWLQAPVSWPESESDGCRGNLMRPSSRKAACEVEDRVAVSGLCPLETSEEGTWRWALGPVTRLRFNLACPCPVVLQYRVNNPLEGQEVRVEANGQVLQAVQGLPPQKWLGVSIEGVLTFQGQAGENAIDFTYKLFNNPTTRFFEQESRPLALVFTAPSVQPDSTQPCANRPAAVGAGGEPGR